MNNEEPKLDFPAAEEEILEFWKKNKIFEKSVEQRKKGKKFVFYEGPPYANGRPGIHHVEARAFKDIVLRYKTMQGFYVPRRAGWDTHGLPTEIEVEKKLNIKSKKDIEEKIGIEKFVEEARANVFLYKEEWEKLTERMGYWLDMENAYVTMDNDYIETLWWMFKEIDKKKLLYEDYKILPWCPRCGTALSSHEVSQGYKKVKEESIYIKFKVKSEDPEWQNTSILVWTTTPWTLPSNVALAINPGIEYACIPDPSEDGHWFVLGKKNFEILLEKNFFPETYKNLLASQIDLFFGREMVGIEYEPLYRHPMSLATSDVKIYKIFGADFVSADDGTGVVHIAPAFGEDDMNLGKANNLPVLSLADEEGKMLTPNQKWNGMFIKDADPLIVEDLKTRDLLYKTEAYEHDYPFCWRCDSPLMYYAKTSWWLKTTAVKQKMINENKKIHWHPDYLKEGRFGEWLKDLRDWAISRERYWGTPLPIWRCGACENYSVVGSFDELKKKSLKSGNKYFVMRHGFAEHNLHNIASSSIENDYYKLLPRGKREIAKTAAKLNPPAGGEKIDLILSSDFSRTRETAAAVANILRMPKENIFFDARLRDVNVGIFDAKPDEEYHKYFSSTLEKFSKTPPNGENLIDLKNRLMRFLYETEEKYKGRNILIITHEYPIWLLQAGVKGLTDEETVVLKGKKKDFIGTGQMMKLDFIPLSHNQNYVLDPHRPYIDKILLKCEKCGGKMRRVNGVADVWFDSGAMPFAQAHYPFAKRMEYPADYICEAIDQTRGWFYTLLADASLLGRKSPYKNVLSLGLVLDANGQKMSKSRGNAVSPRELIDKYGADAVRWYFYTINQPWDEKLFKESDVRAALRRFILIFWNCFIFWKTYENVRSRPSHSIVRRPTSLINKWLLARFNQVALKATKMLDNYDVVSAGRLLEKFVIEDISHWYIRRIRESMKNSSSKEAKEINAVSGKVIIDTAKILAPFLPFISEMMYQEMKGAKKSIHLENWPEASEKLKVKSEKLLKDMEIVRDIVVKTLEARGKAGIRVRQPIASLKIKSQISNLKNNKALLELIKGEANVKEIIFDKNIKEEIEIDIVISEELREEGILRDLMRQIQDIRKKEGRKPSEMLEFFMATDEKGKNFIVKYAKELKKSINAKSITVRAAIEGGYDIKVGELNLKIKL